MSGPKRTGRRVASQLATTAQISTSSAFLPRAVRRGKQPLTGVAGTDSSLGFDAVLEFTQDGGKAVIDYDASRLSTDQATFMIWIKTTVKTPQFVFETFYSQPDIYIQNDQICVNWAGAGNPIISADTRPISDGAWHHIAVSFSNGVITFYKDGLATLEAPSVSTSTGGNHPVNMGGTWAGIPSFIGQMWNIQIWSVPMSADEIQSLMYQTSFGDTYPTDLALMSSFSVTTNTFTNRSNNATATLTNANITWDALPPAPTYAFAIPGGGNDYVDITNGSMTSVSSTAATFECWLKMSTAPGVSTTPQMIMQCHEDNDAAPLIAYTPTDRLGTYWNGGVGTSADTRPISDGAWHHIAVVFNQNQVTFYKDGLPTNETFTLDTTRTSSGDLQLGSGLGPNHTFNGLITDVRVWSVARSVGDIQSTMYTTLTGTEAGLVALNNLSYYNIDDASTQVIKNQVNGNGGFLAGNASVVEIVGPQSQQPVPQNVWTYNISGVPLGPQVSPKGLIYAQNLYDNNYNPTASYLRSIDFQDHTVNWTYSVHDNSKIPTPTIPASVSVGNTAAYVAAQATDRNGFGEVELHAVNLGTGQPVWGAPASFSGNYTLTKPVEAGNIVVIGTPALMYENEGVQVSWVDTTTATVQSMSIPFKSHAEYMSDPIIRTISSANGPITMAYFLANDLYPQSHVIALNLTDKSVVWDIVPSNDFYVGGIAIDQDRLYAVSIDKKIVALNLSDGSIAWTKAETGLTMHIKPVVIGTTVYFGGNDSILYALDGATGTELWRLNAGSAIITNLISEDGAIYFATQGNLSTGGKLPPTFFSVDSASQGNDVLTYPVPDADTILFDQGQSNGVVYFCSINLYAVNMDMILHEFNVDTKLIVEDYDTSADYTDPNSKAVGNDTSYRLTLSLFDPLKMPRVNQAVKVWSSDTVYLANMTNPQGSRLTIGPNTPMWVQTDGSGKVTLAVSAYDDGSHGGTGSSSSPLVNCPALYAWANFMMPGEAIVIYPDHEHLGKLANVQAQSSVSAAKTSSGRLATDDTLSLNGATGYDDTSLIQSQYQDSASLDAIASTIRNTIGIRNTASASVRIAESVRDNAPANKYIAYPAAMPNVTYASDNTQPTTRPFVPGSDATFTMDLSSGKPIYQPGTFDPNPPAASAASISSIFSDIGHFVTHVVKGAEKVAKLAWQFTENAVSTVIHTAESIYNLTITSLEDAVTAVVGFIKSVVNDIKEVIEWLSALFHWEDILTNHTMIRKQISNPNDPNNPGMLDRMQTWLNNQLNLISNNQSSDIDTVYSSLHGQGQSSMTSAQNQTAGTTVQSVQGQNSNPNNVYNYSPDGSTQNNSSQCQWMHQKTMENSNGASFTSPHRYMQYLPLVVAGNASANSHHPTAAPPFDAAGLASSPDPDALTGILGTFIGTLTATIQKDFADFPDQVKAKASTMGDKTKSSKSLLGNAMADIMAVFETLADDAIEIGKDIAGAFLKMVNDLLSQIVTWLNTPINIPFISALYKLITHGDDLTILDLVALIVAVPTTVLMKVISGSTTVAGYNTARAEARAAGTLAAEVADINAGQLFSGIAAVVVGLVASVADAVILALSIPFNGNRSDVALKLPSFLDLALDVMGWALGMVENFVWKGSWEPQDWVFWAIQGWTPLMSFIYSFASNTIVAQTFRDFLYGFVFLVTSICYAIIWPDDYKDAHGAPGLVFTANLFSSLNSMVEINLQPEEEAESEGTSDVVAIAGKVLFGAISAILSFSAFVDTLVHPPSSAQRSSQQTNNDRSVAPADGSLSSQPTRALNLS